MSNGNEAGGGRREEADTGEGTGNGPGHELRPVQGRWEEARAWDWYGRLGWLCGFNYVPSTAVNTTEMWSEDTFDPLTIERELSWARDSGFNTCRVLLQYLVWESGAAGLRKRLDRFIRIAAKHRLWVVPCLFDDCAHGGKDPHLGHQEPPVPGVYSSRWTPSPGHSRVFNPACWPRLEAYVLDVIGRFARDRHVLFWDLYNEPGNGGMGIRSLPLLRASFSWARLAEPQQPLTAGIWERNSAINRFLLDEPDILSFHSYGDAAKVLAQIRALKTHRRPVMCTEWMARTEVSALDTHLPLFRDEAVGCYMGSLVNGRTQKHIARNAAPAAGEPTPWRQDLLHADGRPYDRAERALIRQLTRSCIAPENRRDES